MSTNQQAVIVLAASEPSCVHLAAADLVQDVQKITGKTLRIVSSVPTQGTFISISTQNKGAWEMYDVTSRDGNLYIKGSDERGTMFGIYHFLEEYLRVDPLYFWSDREPEKRTTLSWNRVLLSAGKPTFKYRGWFINDEDLLTEWYPSGGKRNIDYPYYGEVVNPAIMEKVVESLVRCRLNLIIPASFIDIRNPAEAELVKIAARRGVFVSMHHVEPMGVSAFTYFNYWKEKNGDKPLFSFYSNRANLEEVWRVYAREWAEYPNVIWQIGLRGIADRPMWMADPGVPQSDAERGRLISEAMRVQSEIIRQVDTRPQPPVTTTLWAEGSVLNQQGHLVIPKGVTMVFSDNSPGWRMQQDFKDTPRTRDNTYGVYYHHQLWGSGPHLVQIVPPAQTRKVLNEVVKKGDTTYAIMNVSNLREFVYGIATSAAMMNQFSQERAEDVSKKWFADRFGTSAPAVQRVYDTYFGAFALNSKTGTPILMDGQTNSGATSVLHDLRLQLTDPAQYQALQERKKQDTEEGRWARTALADMRGEALGVPGTLQQLKKQKQGHQEADRMAKQVLPQLDEASRRFFETNLLTQLTIMLGLENWYESVLEARLALNEGRKEQAQMHLRNALSAFEPIKKAQAQNAAGEKWQHWYRGDKKMNLKAREKLTGEVTALLAK
ncbi:glycosyl hydrolase 115 family protein [Telluribacter humicola]|uniref:glycosyl hydrolase 115 family protein n=1 Tax=Telluribacter humicola TaxID=1720261 RepID=UPI001A973F7A|nr:glycosyl hydrolase 115 family protein [Telluribacter humicola]